MIRDSVLYQIYAVLGHDSFFAREDFELDFPDNRHADRMKITYKFAPEFTFLSTIPNATTKSGDNSFDYLFQSDETPGVFVRHEHRAFRGVEAHLTGIAEWTTRTREELEARPINRKVNQMAKRLQSPEAQLNDVQKGMFTEDEVDDLRAKIDKLEQELQARIENLESKSKKDTKRPETLCAEIVGLKTAIESLDRKGWFKRSAARVVAWASDPANRNLLSSTAKLLLEFLPEPARQSFGAITGDSVDSQSGDPSISGS